MGAQIESSEAERENRVHRTHLQRGKLVGIHFSIIQKGDLPRIL